MQGLNYLDVLQGAAIVRVNRKVHSQGRSTGEGIGLDKSKGRAVYQGMDIGVNGNCPLYTPQLLIKACCVRLNLPASLLKMGASGNGARPKSP